MDLELTDEQRTDRRRPCATSSAGRSFRASADLDPDADELPRDEYERLVAKVEGDGPVLRRRSRGHSAGPGVDTVTFTLMSIELSQHRAGLYAPCYGVFGGSGLAQLLEANDDQRRALPVSRRCAARSGASSR